VRGRRRPRVDRAPARDLHPCGTRARREAGPADAGLVPAFRVPAIPAILRAVRAVLARGGVADPVAADGGQDLFAVAIGVAVPPARAASAVLAGPARLIVAAALTGARRAGRDAGATAAGLVVP